MNTPTDSELAAMLGQSERLVRGLEEQWKFQREDSERKKRWQSKASTALAWSLRSAVTAVIAVLSIIVTLGPIRSTLDHTAAGIVNKRTANEENVPLAASRIASVTASTFRENFSGEGVFFPQYVIDDNAATAWAECKGGDPVRSDSSSRRLSATFAEEDSATAGCRSAGANSTAEGKGEWLQINLVQPATIKAIRIRNGFQKTNNAFFRNPRIAEVDVTIDAKPVAKLDPVRLSDDIGYQGINLPTAMSVTSIRFTIISVYPGEGFPGGYFRHYQPDDSRHRPYSDVSISDIELIPSTLDG